MNSLHSAHALLVDDQALVRTAIRTMLGALGVTHIYEAASGEEAIAVLLEQPIDFVISDIDMAPQNGMEFLRNIRCGNYGMRRDIRLIMLTGLTAPEVAKACVSLDVNAFLTKPAKRDMLERRLEFALTVPMNLESVDYYRQQELPALLRAQPMVSRPTPAPAAPTGTAPARKPMPAIAPAATSASAPPHESKPGDGKFGEYGMAYVIWHERFQTGIAEVDAIIRGASLKLNETYQARGNASTVQSVDRRVQDWLSFAHGQLADIEVLLAPTYAEEKIVLLARLRRELISKLSQLRLLLQAAPDVASYELFDAVRAWWSTGYNTWRLRE